LSQPSKINAFVGQVPYCPSRAGGKARTIGEENDPIQLVTVGLDEFQAQEVIDCLKKIDSSFSGDSTLALPGINPF